MNPKQKNLRSLFDEKLKIQIAAVEKDRLYIRNRIYVIAVFGIIAFYLISLIPNEVLLWALAFSLFIGLAILAVPALLKYVMFRHQYKEKIVAEVIHFIDSSFEYNPYHHINLADFNASKLYEHGARANGDDFVEGIIENTHFQYSELKVGATPQNTNDSKQSYFFRGIFFFADFNKMIQGETFVLPDRAEKILGKWGQNFQSFSAKGSLVKLENPAFEQHFVVYSTSQTEARYILTPVMMEALVKIKEKYPFDLHFSFTGNRVNCAIPFNQNLFEPQVFGQATQFEDVEYIFELFELIKIFIHEMNLNPRIWTKD